MDSTSDSMSDSVLQYSELLDFCESDDGDEDDSNFYCEMENIEKDRKQQNDYEFVVLSRDEIMAEMLTGIYEVINILNISEPFARVLLNKFKWNKQQLIEEYFNTADLTKFYREFHISNPETLQTSNTTDNSSNDCRICLKKFDTSSYSLQCGHRFCSECWAEYLNVKIFDFGKADVIECAEHNCGALVDDQSVMELLDDSQAKQQYQILIINTFVLCHPLLRWCNAPNCKFAIKVTKIEPRSVMCKCGSEQCLQCGEIWHEPVTCEMLKEFKAMSCEDIETASWIKKNTKPCPKCLINIEKNGGCNHVSCKSCGHEYCWVCMGPWLYHNSCNQYRPNSSQIVNHARFSHYNLRYLNHNQSMKVEWRLNSQPKMIQLRTEIEISFYRRAVATLQRSRRILMSTYIFAYSSKQSNQLLIFEANQNDLENATEKLSQYLEQDISNKTLDSIQHLRTYCDNRQKILLDHIKEGYENGWWNE